MTTSVDVANRLLHFAFMAKRSPTYGNLALAVAEVEKAHLAETGQHAFDDHRDPAMDWKLSTVNPKLRIKRYVPLSDGNSKMVVPDKGSALDRAIRAAFGIHLI